MLHPLEHLQFIVHHPLIALHVLFQDYFYGIFVVARFGFSHDTVCARSQRLSKLILIPDG